VRQQIFQQPTIHVNLFNSFSGFCSSERKPVEHLVLYHRICQKYCLYSTYIARLHRSSGRFMQREIPSWKYVLLFANISHNQLTIALVVQCLEGSIVYVYVWMGFSVKPQNKAVERGDKRTRRFQVRVLALWENPRRVRVRVSTLQEKVRRGRVLNPVLRDTPSPRTSTRSLDTGSLDSTRNTEH